MLSINLDSIVTKLKNIVLTRFLRKEKFNKVWYSDNGYTITPIFKNIELYIINMDKYVVCVANNRAIYNPASYLSAKKTRLKDFFTTYDDRYLAKESDALEAFLVASRRFISCYNELVSSDIDYGINGKNKLLAKAVYANLTIVLLELKGISRKL